jgi:hypothetical protein
MSLKIKNIKKFNFNTKKMKKNNLKIKYIENINLKTENIKKINLKIKISRKTI